MVWFIIFWILLSILAIFIAKEHIAAIKYNKMNKNTLIGKSHKDIRPYYLLWLLILLLMLLSIWFLFSKNNTKLYRDNWVEIKYWSWSELTTEMYENNTGYVYYYFDNTWKLQIDWFSGGKIVDLYDKYMDKTFLEKYIDNEELDVLVGTSGIYLENLLNWRTLDATINNQETLSSLKNNVLNEDGQIILEDNDDRCSNDKHWENETCINNVREAYVKNWKGIWIWDWMNWEWPMIKSCDDWYIPKGNDYWWGCFKFEEIVDIDVDKIEVSNSIIKLDLPDDCQRGVVERVVDGDTIVVAWAKIRLIWIDTPETVHPSIPVEFYWPEASQKMNELVWGKNVCLAWDYKLSDQDKYGRFLRYVYLEDATFVNAEMVKLGYAEVYLSSNYFHKNYFLQLEKLAKESNIGIWSD